MSATTPASASPKRALAAGLIALLAAWPVAAAAPPPSPGPEAARMVTLRNGARMLLVPDPRASSVGVAVWIEAGVKYERAGTNGITHLAEHLSAFGVAPEGEDGIRRRIEAVGGTAASFTTADFTCFSYAIPPGALEQVFQLEAGRFNTRLTQALLDQGRTTTREEIRTRASVNPVEAPLQRLYEVMFAQHPYRWPVLGRDADLARLTLKECDEFLRSRYAPDQALITVVGNFDPEEALALARRTLEPIGRRGGRRAPSAPVEPARGSDRRRSLAGELPVPVLAVGWQVPRAASDDAAALDLVSTLLSGGPSGRLFARLVAGQQTCLFARTGRDEQRDATVFWAAAALRPGADSAAVENDLVAEVERLAAGPVEGEELDRARRQLEVAILAGRQSAGDLGQTLGTAQMLSGDWRDADRRLERLRALTPADVQQAAARTLAAARRTIVWSAAGVLVGEGSRP